MPANKTSQKKCKTLVVAGGVAANQLVRSQMAALAQRNGLELLVPPPKYCVDNGVMVAWTGLERFRQGLYDEPPSSDNNAKYFAEVMPKWPLGVRDGRSSNFKERISAKMKEAQKQKKEHANGTVSEALIPTLKRREGVANEDGVDEQNLSKKALKRLKKAEFLAERKREKLKEESNVAEEKIPEQQ